MSSSGAAMSLSRGPMATTIRVKELVERVRQGAVRVPDFQRPMRWKSKDVAHLLDSVWRGYPIGSLLFWQRPAPAEKVRIGSHIIDAPDVADAWWLVDGQQRTTSLAACLLDLDQGVDRRWALCFDPRTKQFREGIPGPSERATLVPLAVLGDLRRLMRWIRESGVKDEHVGVIEEAQQRILEYSIPAYLVESKDEGVLREIFARLNSSGARMRADEIFRALHGRSGGSSPGRYDLDQLVASCDVDSFGQPGRADLFKTILAIAGQDPSMELPSSIDALSGLPPTVEIENAVGNARAFLQNDCQIPWIGLLPYPAAFALLARWFYCFPETDSLTRISLRRWLWRSVVWASNANNKLPHLSDLAQDVQEGDLENSLRGLMARVESANQVSWTLRPFNHQDPRTRVELLAMLSKHPSDELGPLRVQSLVAQAAGQVGREVFVDADTNSLDVEARKLAKTAANRVILDGGGAGLTTKLSDWKTRPELLASHLIDPQVLEALVNDDAKAFVSRRSMLVVQAVDEFLRVNANFDEPFVRPVESYLDTGDAPS